MAFPDPPSKIVAFNSGSVAPHDIGRQFDEHRRATSNVIDFLKTIIRDDGVVRETSLPPPVPRGGSKEPTLPVGVLGPNAGGFHAGDDKGATATSADYAQVSIEWAEHMPDTIPPNILAINAITGDHWSSRWWANKAALIYQALIGAAALPLPASAQALAGSLYYVATAGQTSFVLATPDRFGLSYTLRISSQVKVSRNGQRLMPDDGSGKGAYTVLQPGNRVTLLWPAGVDETITVDVWEPLNAIPPVTSAHIAAVSLYYVATQGQTSFSLFEADRFALSYALSPVSHVQVSRNGQRLMPDDGTGKGGYVVIQPSSEITLLWPAGQDETVAIDVWEPA